MGSCRQVRAKEHALSAVTALLVGAGPAAAAVERTQEWFSQAVVNPCNGETGTLSGTRTLTRMVRETSGQFLFQLTTQTDETFTPDDPASPSATGHGTNYDTFIDNHAGGPPFSGTTVITHVSTDIFFASGVHVVIHDTAHTVLS